jgi:hypothetical protein
MSLENPSKRVVKNKSPLCHNITLRGYRYPCSKQMGVTLNYGISIGTPKIRCGFKQYIYSISISPQARKIHDFRKEPSPTPPKHAHSKLMESYKPLSAKSMETISRYWKSTNADFRMEPSPTHPQNTQLKLIRSYKPFSVKLTETNFKMVAVAATLKIETRRISKGIFPSPPTRTLKID